MKIKTLISSLVALLALGSCTQVAIEPEDLSAPEFIKVDYTITEQLGGYKLVLEALQFTLFSIKDHLIETEQYEAIQDIDSIIAEVQTAIIINADTDEDDSNS